MGPPKCWHHICDISIHINILFLKPYLNVFDTVSTCTNICSQFCTYPIGSMYAIYGNIYHQYTPNVSMYTSTMDPMGTVGSFSTSLSRKSADALSLGFPTGGLQPQPLRRQRLHLRRKKTTGRGSREPLRLGREWDGLAGNCQGALA